MIPDHPASWLRRARPTTSPAAQALVTGLSLGSIYALLAMGFVIIFKATQVLNFAHGALAALGAFLVALFATVWDIPQRWLPDWPAWITWTISVTFALVAAALVGMALERVFIRPMVGEELFAVAIVTLGIDIALRTVTNDFIGTDSRPLGDPWGTGVFDLGWVRIAHTEMVQLVGHDRPGAARRPVLPNPYRHGDAGDCLRPGGGAGAGYRCRADLRGRLGDRRGAGGGGRDLPVALPAPWRRSRHPDRILRLRRLSGDHPRRARLGGRARWSAG